MKKSLSVTILVTLLAIASSHAQSVTKILLDTVDSGEGGWQCLFYELNYNSDIAIAEQANWSSLEEDESYWREGVGPFSIDANKFLVTQWQSTIHPILIRRHFTLSAEDIENINSGTLTLLYSYDENPKIWINGTLLVSATGWNDNNYSAYTIKKSKKSAFVEGDNVLCVSVQQGEGGGHIDYGLQLKYTPTENGIAEIEDYDDSSASYNILGQKANPCTMTSGIVITNGKKQLIK